MIVVVVVVGSGGQTRRLIFMVLMFFSPILIQFRVAKTFTSNSVMPKSDIQQTHKPTNRQSSFIFNIFFFFFVFFFLFFRVLVQYGAHKAHHSLGGFGPLTIAGPPHPFSGLRCRLSTLQDSLEV